MFIILFYSPTAFRYSTFDYYILYRFLNQSKYNDILAETDLELMVSQFLDIFFKLLSQKLFFRRTVLIIVEDHRCVQMGSSINDDTLFGNL